MSLNPNFASGKLRARKGAASVELTASLLFAIPLLMMILFAAVEMVQAYSISSVLAQAANQCARQLAVLYPDNKDTIGQRSVQDILVYNNCTYGGIIANSAQFEDAVFDTSADPPTVTVNVRYTGGQYGLSPFPAFDPLGWGSSFTLRGSSIYKIESN